MIDGLHVLAGGVIGVILALVLTAVAIVVGCVKRAYLNVVIVLLFLVTSAGGCGYFWKHFDIPSNETGSKHMVGLAVFGVAGLLTVVASIATLMKKKTAEPSVGGDGKPAPQP